MIAKMFNAIVAASVITAAGEAQQGQRPMRDARGAPGQGAAQRPTRDGVRDDTGARPDGEHARRETADQQDHEAIVFRFLAEHPDFLDRVLDRADQDGDGRLSPDERAAMREHFRARAAERREQRQEHREEQRGERTEERQERRGERQDRREERQEQRQDGRQEGRERAGTPGRGTAGAGRGR